MKNNPTFSKAVPKSAVGYSGFPLDHFANFTSVAGYLIPIYWDYLDPGDKVNIRTLLRTRTQPLSKPAMATCIERIEWFAVPIDQLFHPFSAKFYGISDVITDFLPNGGYDTSLPYLNCDDVNTWLRNLPTTFSQQSAIPVTTPTQTEAKRLLDAMGVSNKVGLTASTQQNPLYLSHSIGALPFAAYQKIYYDHYRLADREANDVEAYNLDTFTGTSSQTANVTNVNSRFNKLLNIHKRPYMRDYFTSMQVSPLMGSGDPSASSADLGKLDQWLSGLSGVKTAAPGTLSTLPSGGAVVNATSNPSSVRLDAAAGITGIGVANALNPSNIRSMYAVEKLLQVTRAAKKHYDMQTLAHFGVDVPKGLSGESFKLGTEEQYLTIGDVMGTVNNIDSNGDPLTSVGELAGYGKSSTSNDEKKKPIFFEAKCHCILMGIYSAEPVVNLTNEGYTRLISKISANEFYKSEFDDLGQQPVFMYELQTLPSTSATSAANFNATVVGWQDRYAENKAKFNRSFGGCADSYFSEWSLNRTPVSTSVGFSNNFFYVWPTDLNNILLNQYSGALSVLYTYSEDYFINQVYFDITKSSKKSIHGTPNL